MRRFSKSYSFWQGFWSMFGLDEKEPDYFSDPVIKKFVEHTEKEETALKSKTPPSTFAAGASRSSAAN